MPGRKSAKIRHMQPNEVFLITRQPKTRADFSVGWFYPNTYSVGMSGLGYQLVWRLFEENETVAVRRGFTDYEESGIDASELLGFTISWELDFINVLQILDKHGIASTTDARPADAPIVFGGGPVLTANPEPFADIFDVILMGDAEVTVPAFINAWTEARGLESRRERLLALSQVPGLYVPSLYECTYNPASRAIESVAPRQPSVPAHPGKQLFTPPPDYLAHSVILAPETAWGDLFLVEVVRSCPQECRFCLASFLTRPFRAANVDSLMKAIELGLKHTKNIGLLGPSVTEHPHFDEIARRLEQHSNARISVASVRADSLNETVVGCLKKLGQKSLTIAIESGSERLRAVMKKNLSESEIEHAVDLIERGGLDGVKFYGIVGLPHEQQEDLDETVRLMKQLKKTHRKLRFVFGVSSFVPKAQTPFQWCGRDRRSGEKLDFVRKRLAKEGIEVRPESHNWSDIQALISRGDRRLTPIMLAVAKSGGNIGAWKKALRQAPPEFPGMDYFAFRNIAEDEVLPWTHLVDVNRTEYLSKHLKSAAQAAVLP